MFTNHKLVNQMCILISEVIKATYKFIRKTLKFRIEMFKN